jgi:hypothetical protein
VLQGLLDPGSGPWTPLSSRRMARGGDLSTSRDISPDSSPPQNPNNTPPVYHFHGLATTQTQTQHCDDENEGNESINVKRGNEGETAQDGMVVSDTRSSQASSSKNPRRRSPHEEQKPQALLRVTKVTLPSWPLSRLTRSLYSPRHTVAKRFSFNPLAQVKQEQLR